MRIALLTHSVLPRGGVVHTLELGAALRRAGHKVTIFVPALPGERLFRASPCRTVLVPARSTGAGVAAMVEDRIAAFVAHFRQRLDHEGFDVFHTHDGIGGNALADLQDEGRIAGFVRTVHHLDRFADERVAARQARSVRRAARVLCVSALWRERLRAEWQIDATQVGNGVDLERFTPSVDAHDALASARLGLTGAARPRVLAVGGVEARKNTPRLLDAFALLRERLPRAQLVVAGGASLLDHGAAGEAFAEGLGRHGFAAGPDAPVHLTGPVLDADMPALFRLADVFAMPSCMEGFGLAALEALACGTPTVVSRIAPFTEHFADEVHWADPDDTASIAAALRAAAAAPRHRVPPAVCQRYSWAASAASHEAVYRSLVASTVEA